MKKIIKIILVIICAVLSIFILSDCTEADKTGDGTISCKKAVQTGSKILKEKFPDIINKKSVFIAYNNSDSWHIQNVFPDIDYIKKDDIKLFKNISDVRYVKLNNNCTEVICFGSYEEESFEFSVYPPDYAETILNQIYEFKYGLASIDITYDMMGYLKTESFPKSNAESTICVDDKDGLIELWMRKSDGLVVYVTDNKLLSLYGMEVHNYRDMWK